MIGFFQLFIVIAGIIVFGQLKAHSLFSLAVVIDVAFIRYYICYLLSFGLLDSFFLMRY